MTATNTTIGTNSVVSIAYTLFAPTGEIIDQSGPGEPLAYLHGHDNIVPGLERHLEGRTVGDKLDVVIPASEGYGERAAPGPERVPRAAFPPTVDVQTGDQFATTNDAGEQVPLWVLDVQGDTVVIDFNHPLAGMPLHFRVEVMSVRMATKQELAHGHVHGPHGHDH